jgi:hypothetical protein
MAGRKKTKEDGQALVAPQPDENGKSQIAAEATPGDDGLGMGLDPELLTDEIRRARVNWAVARLDEEDKYPSVPVVQQKLRNKFGTGMNQKFVYRELSNLKQKQILDMSATANEEEPLMADVKRCFEHPAREVTNLIKRARAQERQIAEGSIRKIQQEATADINRIERELTDFMEEVERLTAENERLADENTHLKVVVTQKDTLLCAMPAVPVSVEQRLDAIMTALSTSKEVADASGDSCDEGKPVVSARPSRKKGGADRAGNQPAA